MNGIDRMMAPFDKAVLNHAGAASVYATAASSSRGNC